MTTTPRSTLFQLATAVSIAELLAALREESSMRPVSPQTLRINQSVALRNAGYAALARQSEPRCPECGDSRQIMDDHPLDDLTAPTYSDCPQCTVLKAAALPLVVECPERGMHVFAFVRESIDGTELWRCACGQEAQNARDYGLQIDAEDESEWEGHRL